MNAKIIFLMTAILISSAAQAFNIVAVGTASNDNMFDTRSCGELYTQVATLEKQAYFNKQDYYTDTNDQAAIIASTMFTPTVYYFGFAAYKDFKAKKQVNDARLQLDALRVRMAEKRCFAR